MNYSGQRDYVKYNYLAGLPFLGGSLTASLQHRKVLSRTRDNGKNGAIPILGRFHGTIAPEIGKTAQE